MPRRRALLRALGGVATAGILAGCQDIGEIEDEDSPDSEIPPGEGPERIDFPELSTGEPTYREWIPEESELDLDRVTAVNVARLRAQKDQLSPTAYENLGRWVTRGDYFGVQLADIDGQIIAHRASLVVHLGEFDRDSVRDTLTATGYQQRETRGGITFYLDDTRNRAFAVGDHGVIERPTLRDGSFPEQATTLFETAAGERARRYQNADPFRLFADQVGWPLRVTLPRKWIELDSPRRFEDPLPTEAWYDTHYGSAQHAADGAMVTRHWFGAPEDEGSAQLLRSAFEDAAFPTIDEQRVAVREMRGGAEVAALAPFETTGGGTDPIQVTLTASLDGGALVLDHRAGDLIPAGRLTVRWENEEYVLDDSIEPGDTRRVEGRDFANTVSVVYSPPDGESLALLAQVDAG